MRRTRIALALFATCLWGCASEGIRLTEHDSFPTDRDPVLFVVASRQKARILASLHESGFRVAGDVLEAPYFLRVTVGVDKGRRACGPLANVKYELRYADRGILDLAAAGWTGSCPDNVFDAMSRRLMGVFENSNAEEIPR
jgi:hypothetical protein